MEKFSLEKYLENPNRKVVTRQCKSVRIICTDRRHTDSWPIVALEDYGDGEFVIYANIDGRTDMCSENIHDLFFADEKEELTEFDYAVLSIISDHNSHTDSIEAFAKRSSKKLLGLARKEIEKECRLIDKDDSDWEDGYKQGKQDALKDLPKWRKATKCKEFDKHVCVMDYYTFPFLDTEVNEGDYYIKLEDLKTLPKEE